jgi:hypothetical protein
MRRAASSVFAGAGLVVLAGCSLVANPIGAPADRTSAPDASGSPAVAGAAPSVSVPVPTWSFASIPPSSAGPHFPEGYAVSCAGQPGAAQVTAVLKARGLLASTEVATPQTGPLCAGTWQYTVLTVTGREPLQVVTKGAPSALVLVTAGTDVCSVTVRTEAPAGIVAVAHCAS